MKSSYSPSKPPTGTLSKAAFRPIGGGAGLSADEAVDPNFSEEALKETFQDLFFKVQAAWMSRSLEGVERSLRARWPQFSEPNSTP